MYKLRIISLILRQMCIFFTTVFITYELTFAQTRLTWETCLSHFEKNNPNLKAATFNLTSSELQYSSVRSGYFPQLNLNVNSILDSSSKKTIDINNSSASLTVTQNLFSGFSTQASVTLAQANILLNKATMLEIYSNSLYDLKLAFANLLFAQKTHKLLDDIIVRRQQNNDIVKLRFTNGKESKGSVLLAEANLKLAQFEKFQNQNIIKQEQQKMKSLIGLEEDDIELSESLNSMSSSEKTNFEPIIINHPKHQLAEAQKIIAEANLNINKSTFYPELNLQYTYNTTGSNFKFEKNSWSTGLNLSWSLFNGGKNYYMIQSQIEIKNARELQLLIIDRNILDDLIIAKNQLIEANEKYFVDEAFLKAAIVREQISRSKYNNGLSNFDDWDQMESELISRQKNLLKSEQNKIISTAAWLKAQGKGATE